MGEREVTDSAGRSSTKQKGLLYSSRKESAWMASGNARASSSIIVLNGIIVKAANAIIYT